MNLFRAQQIVDAHYQRVLKRSGEMTSPDAVGKFLCARYAGLEYEVFTVLFLDAQNRLIEAEDMFRGSLTQTSVYPREVIKEALRRNAGGVVFAHNHPSGVAKPSQADELLTRNLKAALALVDIRVLDHFVVGGPGDVVSMAALGLL